MPKPPANGTSIPHGTHTRYTYGCRCDPCREAKSAYTRAARRAARELRPPDGVVTGGITHGPAAYQNLSCRCPVCVEAKRAADSAYRQRRKHARRVNV